MAQSGLDFQGALGLRSGVVLGTAGVFYTIPSLALYGLLVPYTGLSRTTSWWWRG